MAAFFGLAKAGESVRFTIRRGGSSRTVTLKAAPPAASTVDLAKSSESLERAQVALRELQRDQQTQMQKIQEELRASRAAEADQVHVMTLPPKLQRRVRGKFLVLCFSYVLLEPDDLSVVAVGYRLRLPTRLFDAL